MATTRLIPLHAGKARTTSNAIQDIIDYIENPEKTDNGRLITGYQCDTRLADEEFMLSKRQYNSFTGRSQGAHDVIAYHTRQSFKPGETTAEEANRIGYELSMAFTKGKHQFIVATHIDKQHIHNHIIINSTAIDCTRKFRNFWGSAHSLRRISDRICIENGLSVIENPKPSKGHYGTWLGDEKPITWRERLRQTIETVLSGKPADFTTFIQEMKTAGYEVKQGKYLSFRAPEQKKFTRLRSLGKDYSDDAIRECIEGKRTIVTTTSRTVTNMNLLIDIQNSIKAKNSPGYEQWAKVFNLKQAAQTLIFLQENNLTEYKTLEEKAAEATNLFNSLSVQIKEKETRLNEITTLQKNISNYRRTREIYVEYRKSGYSKKFLSEHEGDIIIHQAAKKVFDALHMQKLPTIKSLQTEYATALAEKKKLYQLYRQAKTDMQRITIAKSNTDRLLRYSVTEKTLEKDSQRS